MKTILFISLIFCTIFVSAQSYDEETGLRFYKNKQYEAAVPYLQRAAKSGSAKAQDYLGYMYEKGLGVEKNYVIAMNLYKKAHDAGYGPGIVSMGRLYEYGLGVDKNPSKAFSYYSKAAKIGCAEGEYQTGLCYYYGYGTTQNYAQAIEYLKRSTTGGYGYEILGDIFYTGTGTKIDLVEAFHWYTKNKPEYYSETARIRLAIMYQKGQGGVVNRNAAMQVLKGLNSSTADSLLYVITREQENIERAARVVTPAKYPGGNQALYAFLKKNMRKPHIAIETAGYGTTGVQFIITRNGEVTGANYKQRCNVRVDEEVMRLVKILHGWTPATKGGRPCDAVYQLDMSIFPSFSANLKFIRIINN